MFAQVATLIANREDRALARGDREDQGERQGFCRGSWNGVIERLQQRGYPVIAPAHPLRGVAAAFSDVSGPPAWKKLPCWAVVATGDKAAGAVGAARG